MHELELKHNRKVNSPRLAVVLLHGIAANAAVFGGLLEHLESMKTLKAVQFLTFNLLGDTSRNESNGDYGYGAQIAALDKALSELAIDAPLVILGHSMGALIAAKYTSLHPDTVKRLIMISLPLYTRAELENPAFTSAMQGFEAKACRSLPGQTNNFAFRALMDKIVMAPDNYEMVASLIAPRTIIYGEKDALILPDNYYKLKKKSSSNTEIIATSGGHSMTPDKFLAVEQTLERTISETI